MTEDTPKTTLRNRIRWWLYARCFAYCVRCVFPTANPADFTILDNAEFVAISKDEIREIIEEAPDVAWHFSNLEVFDGKEKG